ncbi:MAG: hypothetical protein ABSA84_01615 [Gammaproteobacteria bacterium]
MKIIIPTKPQNMLQIIKTSFSIWKRALIKTIPFSLISIIAHSILMPVFLDFWDKLRGYKWDQFSLNLIFSKHCILLGGTIVLYAIVFSITNVSIIYIINKIANNENVYFSQAITTGANKAFSQLLIHILYFIIFVIAIALFMVVLFTFPMDDLLHLKLTIYICCILPFIPSAIIFVYIMFANYLLIIEENSIVDSIKNSFKLVLGNWRYTFGAFLMISILHSACSFILDSFSVNDIIRNSFSIIFIAPFNSAFIIAILYNLIAKNRDKLEINAAPIEHCIIA